MSFKYKSLASICLGASLAALSPVAISQEARSDDDTELRMQETIVTARKREESIQSVPLSITAVSAEQFANEGAFTIEDIQGLAPNVVIDPVSAGPGAAAISIRGISFEDIEKSFDPTVGVVIDGVFLGTNTGQLLNSFDFEQIEVLRGPQGTLFGRNTIGGVINIRRTRPTGEFGGRFQANIGEFGRREYSAVVNAPLGDFGGIKGFFFDRSFDGFANNVTTGLNDGEQLYQNFGAAIDLNPTENLNFLLTVEAQEYGGDPSSFSASGATDLICTGIPGVLPPFAPANECNLPSDGESLDTFANFVDTSELDEFDVTGEINWDIGNFTLTSITAYRDFDELQTQDFDATSADFFATSRAQTYEQFSQELRVAGPVGERLDFVLGAYFFDSRYTLDQATDSPLFFTMPPATPFVSPGQLRADVEQDTQSFAFFADVDVQLAEQWRLNLGGRYTRDEKDFIISNDIFFSAIDTEVPLFAAPEQTATFDRFTPRIALDYQPSNDLLLYTSWSRGFRSGGFNGRAGSLTSIGPFDEEIVDSFDVGFKSEWFENRFRLNGAFFYSIYDDKQEEIVRAVPGAAQETVVENASDATIWGIELDWQYLATEYLSFYGSVGYLNAEFDSFDTIDAMGAPLDLSSLELRRAPDLTFSVTGDYTRPIGPGEFNASLSFRYSDEYETTIVPAPAITPAINDPRGTSESEENLSFSLGYSFETDFADFKVTAYGRNLIDDRGIGSTLPVAGLFTFSSVDAPQQFGVSIGVDF